MANAMLGARQEDGPFRRIEPITRQVGDERWAGCRRQA
jgi:hypothetical protein